MTALPKSCARTAWKWCIWKTWMAEVLDADPAVRKKFLEQFISEAGIRTKHWQKIVYDHLTRLRTAKSLC